MPTDKFRLRKTIMFGNVATTRTFTGSIPGIHFGQQDASQGRLVSQEHFQLEKRPRMQNRALLPPSPYPSTDAGEILHGDSACGAFGDADNALRNAVIGVSGKSALFATEFLEMPFCGPRSAFLESGSRFTPSPADTVKFRATMYSAVAIRGDVDHTEIDAEKIVHVFRIWIVDVTSGCQIERSIAIDQIGFALAVAEQMFLALTGGVSDALAARSCPDGDRRLGKLPRKNTFVVGYCAIFAKFPHCILVQIVCIRDFRDAADNDLGRERELGSDLFIDQTMQGKLTEYLFLPRSLADPVTGGIGRPHGFMQCGCGVVIGYQFNFCRKIHASNIEENALKVNRLKGDGINLEDG